MMQEPTRAPHTSSFRPGESRAHRHVIKHVGRCISDFSLVEADDHVMVCMSGGKDSYVLLHALRHLQRKSPKRFQILAVHLDQGQPNYDGSSLRTWLQTHEVPFHIERENTYSVVKELTPAGKTYCSMCSRLRRGILYTLADRFGCTKIALGHHRDDAIETLLLNLLFSGSIKAMPAKLQSDDGAHTVIRPLLYVAEETIVEVAAHEKFPIIPCNLCGSQKTMRTQVKDLLERIELFAPQARESLLAALGNVRATHLLDKRLKPAVSQRRHLQLV